MRIELHCHSTCSDGSFEPAVVAERASRQQVELFCLTDHDTCAGSAEARAAFRGRASLRGLELSCHHEGRTVHVLVYDAGAPGGELDAWSRLEARLAEVGDARRRRVRAIAERLAELGAPVDADAILRAAGEGSVGRPHVARALVESGAVRSFEEAFSRYLGDGGPADVALDRIGMEEGLSLGRSAGARMALAHPHFLGDLAPALLRRYRDEGLDGVEGWYGYYNAGERRRWLELAAELDLVVTGGSDFHGAASPQVPDPAGVELPDSHARRLCDWLGVS